MANRVEDATVETRPLFVLCRAGDGEFGVSQRVRKPRDAECPCTEPSATSPAQSDSRQKFEHRR